MRVIVNAKNRVISSIYVIFDIIKKSCQIVAMQFLSPWRKKLMTFSQKVKNELCATIRDFPDRLN